VVFNAGVVNLVKGGLLDIVKENHKMKNKEILQKIEKELERLKKRKEKAMKCFQKFKNKHTLLTCPQEIPVDSMTAEDLKTFIMVRKRKSDGALPKTLDDLKSRWMEVRVLSEMNEVEHLLNQGYTREMIDIVLLGNDLNNTQNNEVSPANLNALTMLANVAV
jgi:hypothetical protein